MADRGSQRQARLDAMTRWAQVGVLEPRKKLPVEEDFDARVQASNGTFFRPIELRDHESVTFHRQVSYLVDAFDALPGRPDIAFDSTWKALELASSELCVEDKNITERLKVLAESVDPKIVDRLCARIPVQSCEYLFKRVMASVQADAEGQDRRLKSRINGLGDPQIDVLIDHMRVRYSDGSAPSRRNGSLLLRRALRAEVLDLESESQFALSDGSRARVLISILLYTARNDRFHGESFSPFLSSLAKQRTYTHPLYTFLATYYLLVDVWLTVSPHVLAVDLDGILASLEENLTTATELFGSNWN